MNNFLPEVILRKNQLFFVLFGAIPGALLRWNLNNDFQANIIGSVLVGLITGLKVSKSIQWLFVIGFCGSLTTFSGWMINLLELINTGYFLNAAFVLISTLFLGFLGIMLGFVIGYKIKQSFAHL